MLEAMVERLRNNNFSTTGVDHDKRRRQVPPYLQFATKGDKQRRHIKRPDQESPSSSRARRQAARPPRAHQQQHDQDCIHPCTQRSTSVSSMDTTGSNPDTVAQRMGRAERREGSMGPHHKGAKRATTAGGGTAPVSGSRGDAERGNRVKGWGTAMDLLN